MQKIYHKIKITTIIFSAASTFPSQFFFSYRSKCNSVDAKGRRKLLFMVELLNTHAKNDAIFKCSFQPMKNRHLFLNFRSKQNVHLYGIFKFTLSNFAFVHDIFLNFMNHGAVSKSYEYRLLYLNSAKKIWFVTKTMNNDIDFDLSKISIEIMKNWTILCNASMGCKTQKKWVMLTYKRKPLVQEGKNNNIKNCFEWRVFTLR